MDKKSITLLGSTGSVGKQALDVADFHEMKVDALCFGSNIACGEEQIRKFSPRYCAVRDEKAAAELKTRTADTNTKIFAGDEGVCEMIQAASSDICLNAISGFAGLMPTLSALKSCRRLALANKETLVAAGDIVMSEAKRTGCEIIPVDSEHSAIFQCLAAGRKSEVSRLILTCSGGASPRHGGAGARSSYLEYGRENNGGLRHTDEQRAGNNRGDASFRHARKQNRCGNTSRKHNTFDGGIH